MSATIITPVSWETVEEFHLSFDYLGERGWGYGFPCDRNGTPFKPDNDAAAENMLLCFLDDGTAFEPPYVSDFSREVRNDAVARCECGGEVFLTSSYENPCENDCGREYNRSGQLLAPRSQWGSEWVDKPEEDYGYY